MMAINGKTRTCGLIGNPVEHTKSPAIHNTLAQEMGINMAYVPFFVEKGQLEAAVKGAFALDILGMNVTVPYKNDVLAYLDDIDALAKKIGAVNTLVRTDNGYKGYNTDMTGLYRAMESDGVPIRGEEVIILGAGGAGRAVTYMCASNGAKKVFLLNRSLGKAEAVASEVNRELGLGSVTAVALSDYREIMAGEEHRYVAIQCTSVGLSPNDGEVVIDDGEFYRYVKFGYDLIYSPWETKFMSLVSANGGAAYNGLKMLLYQGIDAFELWNRCKVPDQAANKAYEKLCGGLANGEKKDIVINVKNIILTGYMGSGKTTIGKKVAKMAGYIFVDTDEMIAAQEGRSISEIFATDGERAFRDLETWMLERFVGAQRERLVIATGGGMPVREENRRLLRQLGSVVYLKASPEVIYDRIKGDTKRPLLQCDDPMKRIEEMLAERGPLYEDGASFAVNVDGLTPSEAAGEICKNVSYERDY